MKEYLNRVLIYLQKELPKAYRESIEIEDDRLVITILDDERFIIECSELHVKISTNIERVRKREYDLNFIIRSSRQHRDFTILK
ncbi:hypothetical protein [Mucilaginibacter sp.]|uniref:hypothetical protein n=1 Tax=Mucilaginibacter sp. TaxID=1882438 RepID=UPI0026168C05|nr:hypothetical protein [Mucilaginibacter sp.]MDB5130131.1 hypothetical protein [Mucilaginibacter sp.]